MALRRLMESDTEVDIQIRREADKETDIKWSVKGWLDWWKRRRESRQDEPPWETRDMDWPRRMGRVLEIGWKEIMDATCALGDGS